ncbi:MAG: T9SS type A sorting domain-containing protein [Candidatus Pseudobacter hemicellulosilyticus]|uniref:T9SS type A sorting domain-containing protein n=1 Tax=Candidatus Pseudobacter hemicellulosilyticus TaxID=3121375 RepID=A0AAJ6BGU2_9BACT|nr:MAG: T9SS type A sorting domain-containing protein [Pseudobacter sp.]
MLPYTGYFMYGANGGWYGNSWDDKAVADIAAGNPAKNVNGVGVKTFRPTLPEDFIDWWGYNIRIAEFTHYATLGTSEHTVFVHKPVAHHRDNSTYGGCADQSVLWANMYEPIWDGGANGTPVNENNYYALYIYKLVTTYKQWVKFWEILNEPDYDGVGYSYLTRGTPGNWWENAPVPCHLPNMKAPIYHYIRLLRISYEVIKSIDPGAYVTTGGLGYPSFLDAIMRYTDNPNNGVVTSEYPLMGGAYFDVCSFHSYPMYALASWSDAAGGFVRRRHSDAAIVEYVKQKNTMDSVMMVHGYDGQQYPKKGFICTESNIPRKPLEDMIGSDEAQINFIIKTLVASQEHDVWQYYMYMLGDTKDYASSTDHYETMGLYGVLEGKGPLTNNGAYLQQYNNEGYAFKSTSDILFRHRFDAARTAALQLPANIDGAAFRDQDGKFTYVLWAKTTTDQVETVFATYDFPASANATPLMERRTWNFSQTKAVSNVSSTAVQLGGTPIFLTEILNQLPLDDEPTPPVGVDPVRELDLALYPNPTSSTAALRFSLRNATRIRVTIHSADGKLVAVPIPGRSYDRGTHLVPLSATEQLPSGVYFCRFETENKEPMIRKLVITR